MFQTTQTNPELFAGVGFSDIDGRPMPRMARSRMEWPSQACEWPLKSSLRPEMTLKWVICSGMGYVGHSEAVQSLHFR